MEKSYPNVRKSIVELVATGMSISEVSRTTGLSRKAVYKWIARAEAEGIAGLTDRSRARHSYEERFDDERAEWLVALRLKNENWGPTTLLYYAHKHRPSDSWPSKSTVATLLHRRGLILPRRPRATHRMALLPVGPPPLSPNARWTMDFKGDFRLGDRTLVKPFTLRDGFSRMILDVHVTVSTSYEVVKLRLEKAFRAYGMPDEIQSDNGPPFASTGLGLLSALSVWLIRHDVLPVLSRPGKPQDNGAHERMHRDYKSPTQLVPPLTTFCLNSADRLGGREPSMRCVPTMPLGATYRASIGRPRRVATRRCRRLPSIPRGGRRVVQTSTARSPGTTSRWPAGRPCVDKRSAWSPSMTVSGVFISRSVPLASSTNASACESSTCGARRTNCNP